MLIHRNRLSPQQAAEAYHLLYAWAKPEHPLHALALLDVHYADYRVREYAVSILEELSDSDLQQVLYRMCPKLFASDLACFVGTSATCTGPQVRAES